MTAGTDSGRDPVADPAGHGDGTGGPEPAGMEALVAEVWGKVLGVPAVGPSTTSSSWAGTRSGPSA
ncbi:hypothetical protein H4K36_31865 [Streptomyces sp. DHE7-1]|nr:hypothetical protein [Streptomyces sp. DHE7-1]